MENTPESTNSNLFTGNLAFIALCFLIGLAGFGYILAKLPGIEELPTIYIEGPWKLALIITHIITFALIPLAMNIFYRGLKNLKVPAKSIFASQLGLAFIMVAIAAEIGWHVTQGWYYTNEFTMLNFMFYFFLISAFALWSDGLVEDKTATSKFLNIVFALGLLVASILYEVGYEHKEDSFKIPIYILLTLIFAVLTYRGYKLLDDWKIIFVPFFSVGVNLTFVFLLQHYGQGKTLNALFHILHDLLGTETGVAIFAWLVYHKGIAQFKTREQSKLAPDN